MATFPLPPTHPPAGGRTSPTQPVEDEWLFGRYRLEPRKRRLHAGERTTDLDGRACAVLLCLLHHADQVVPRARLIGEAWPEVDTVFDSAVSKVMRRLRTALGDHSGHVLQTVYGEGYRLALPAVLLPCGPAGDGHAAAAPQPQPGAAPPPASTEPRQSGPLSPPVAWLPWAIATLATLAAISLAWLLLSSAGTA